MSCNSTRCLQLLEKCKNLKQLKQAHAQAIICGLGGNNFALSRLLAFCSDPNHGSLSYAWNLFRHIQRPTLCILNTMMKAFLLNGDLANTINAYSLMLFNVSDVDAARSLFDEASVKDRGIWGAMISGYTKNSCFKEALYMFRLMQLTDVEPDEAVFASILCACAHLGALDTGIWIHRYLDKQKLPLSLRLGTGLIDMYAKCGNLNMAKKVFDEMPERDVICWNAMISGMAVQGDGERALELFREMEKAGVRPDDITFIVIFTACCYSGVVFEGIKMLDKMCNVYNIEPKSEHYGCMVDLLSRGGHLEEAVQVIQMMPNSSNPSDEAIAWRALLSACCSHGHTKLAESAAKKLAQLEHHSGAYVLLANLYAAAGKHDDAKRMRKMMKSRGVYKVPGCSSVKINGVVHEFIAGEKSHPQIAEIHLLLEKLDKQLEC
ncbi:hypothetical protein SLEP1_g12466 [Rubroshorea leprosula]|uniref:Pentatricopeptide repeat-containing protein n=1 Tax=Rubroshorea leprosula TaxID=152421 RepID=A0AAV5ILA0_9ROSI|nr:hypothetical protein SLEP1_g12466 [Rubroshorea leprosula]